MMRSGRKLRNCTYCETRTTFERETIGPRGGVSVEPCCNACGEDPARRRGPVFEQAVDIVRTDAGGEPKGPLSRALLTAAERQVAADTLLALNVGLPLRGLTA